MMKCFELIGLECLKAGIVEQALDWFYKAAAICKKVYDNSK